MAHWFHRNPLKATKSQTFENLKAIAQSPTAAKIASDLNVTRVRLVQQLADSRNTPEALEKAVTEYLSLLKGLWEDIAPQTTAEGTPLSGEAKLQKVETFKWTNTICGNTATSVPDAYYELVSVLTNVALWYTKRAAYNASNENLSEDDAKDVFRNLRLAAGIFVQAKNLSESRLGSGLVEKHGDTDPRVLDAYHLQSLGEAQEVTVARAVELKHKPSTVTAVSLGTSNLFKQADESLRSVDPAKANKWRKYLQMKKNIYLAYAHSFKGEELLNEDKCGEAISSLQEAEKCYTMAGMLCKEYASAKGPGSNARPTDHQFYLRLGPIVQSRLEKARHENGFIYHQKVPDEPPELESAEIGIASPMEFPLPSHNPRWKAETLKDFDVTKSKAQVKESGGEGEKIDPVKEVDNPNVKGSQHETGCSIS